MKRDIKKENEIINNIVENVKKFYLWKLNNYSNYDNFILNVYNRIKEGSYDYFENQKDPVMGEFATYMVATFRNEDYPWFSQKDKNRVRTLETKLIKAIYNADEERYAYDHIDEIENKVLRMHIKGLFE